MADEHRSFDDYQEFIEPRQLTLDQRSINEGQHHHRDSLTRDESDRSPVIHDPLTRPYLGIESISYPTASHLGDSLDFNIRDSHSPFLWSGDYGPSMLDAPSGFQTIPFDEWGPRLDERHHLGYDAPNFPSLGFSTPFPGVDELLGHQSSMLTPGPTLPPLHSFAPLSPFSYEANTFHSNSRILHDSQPELNRTNQLPLLPVPDNQKQDFTDEHRVLQDHSPVAVAPPKKARVDKRNTKPLAVEDLLHDNSRFAKVVKAFLSIEDQESRTVPEIAKRVDDMYTGQYTDFEGVKRMVNDVLQKHKAFWHPGRGSPYQLNLNEGRARREFPSNNRRLVRNRFDENMFYSRSKKQKKARQNKKTRQANLDDNDALNHPTHDETSHLKFQAGSIEEGDYHVNDLYEASDFPNPKARQEPPLLGTLT